MKFWGVLIVAGLVVGVAIWKLLHLLLLALVLGAAAGAFVAYNLTR